MTAAVTTTIIVGDSDNNNGGGGQNSKKGNGSDGESNGNGSDKYEEGGGGGSEMDLIGKPGFDYKYRYHARSEFECPVEQLQVLRHQKTLNEIVMAEGLRDVSVHNFQKERFKRTINAYNQHDNEFNYNNVDDHNNGGGGNMTPRFFYTAFHGAQLDHCKKFHEPKYLSCISCN